jgi:hypothetical protein
MKKTLLLCGLLFSAAYAERATVTLSRPEVNSGSCSDSAECPAGSACADGACTVYTVKDGTPGIDYTANKILTLETQLDTLKGALACSGDTDPNSNYRCIEHQVNLFMSDSEVVGNYDSSCSVVFEGGIASKMTGGSGTVTTSADKITCSYTPLNNKYLGYTSAKVTFTKSSGLKLGERAAKIIKVPMTYVPGSAAAGGTGAPEDPSLGNDAHSLITIPSASDGIHSSTSDGGELQLSYRLNVMDDRYKIITQSGVEQLKQSAGDFSLVKEGLDIAGDYTTFYDPSLDSFLNSGANGVALDLDAYKSGACHQRGQSHDINGEAVAMSDASCSAAYDQDNAQYHLEGVYKAKYGNMQHLKEQGGYFACPLCDNALAIQGFDNAGTPEIDVKIAIDASTLQSGCTVDCVTFDNIFADLVASTAYKFAGDQPFLGELFAPKVSGEITYTDLDADFEIIGANRLLIGDDQVAAKVDCGDGAGKVNTLSSDMLASAQELFYEKCKISISGDYGNSSTLTYKDSDLTQPLEVEVHVVDGRRILVGSTELSLSRRQLASVTKIGAAITMDIVKHTEAAGATLTFDVIGTGSMVGYSDSATKCLSVDASVGCDEIANAGEVAFTTSAVNGEIKQHTIRSSPSCNGFLDLQLKDQANPFAVYELRVPCSRTTAAVADKIELKFDFSLSYDLLTNVMDAEALYLDGMASSSVSPYDSANMPAGLSQGLTVVAKYGSCGANDAIDEQVSCSTSQPFTDSATNSKFVSTGNTLAEWKSCADQSDIDDFANGEQYKITTNIALQYTRDVSYATNDALMSSHEFCADRKYVTTINRDASATVTVATLSTPTLERAVTVTEIAWNTCADGYELQIDVKVNQRNVNDAAWSDGILSHVFKASSSTSVDSDSLSIGFNSAADGSVFNLKSACIAIPDCSATAFTDLQLTETDLVLRGDFAGGDAVDSDVRISTNYLECPLDEENVALGGSLKAGATFVCNSDGLSTLNSTEVADSSGLYGAANCDSAFTTGDGTAAVRLFLQADTAAEGDLLTDAEATKADDNGWEIRHNRISLERYEKLMNGDQGGLVSSTIICECGSIAVSRQVGDVCNQAASGITGLDAFNSLTCNFESLDFDFLPLADASVDIIKVHFDILAENNDLDARRHLRHSIQLRSTSPVSAETSGFSVVQAAVHAESVPDASETTTAAPAEDEGLETGAIVGIIAGSVVLVAGGAWVWMRRNDKRASYTSVESEARQARFSNLRY